MNNEQLNNGNVQGNTNGGFSSPIPPMPSGNNNNTKKPFYKKWWFWVIIVLAVIIIGGASSSGNSDDNSTEPTTSTVETTKENAGTQKADNTEETTKKETTVKPTEKPTVKATKVSPEQYKNSCKQMTYKDLSRNPDKYKGQKLTFTGEVIQVLEDEHFLDDNITVDLRINVTKDEYDFWDDTIYATVELPKGSDRILEDDIITIWGECDGKYTYDSVLGSSVTLPKISIKYFKVK